MRPAPETGNELPPLLSGEDLLIRKKKRFSARKGNREHVLPAARAAIRSFLQR